MLRRCHTMASQKKRYCTSNQILEEASLEIKWSKIVAFHIP
jgi:hypothetical protein